MSHTGYFCLFLCLFFSGMAAGSFLGVQSRNQMDREEDRIAQAEFGDVVQLTGQVMDVREKAKTGNNCK